MFLQMFIAVFLIVYALSHARASQLFLGKKAKQLPDARRTRYQKGLFLPFFSLGSLFLIFTFATEYGWLSANSFFILYLVVVLPLIFYIFRYNKKHLGTFFER